MNGEKIFFVMDQDGNEKEYIVLSSFFSDITNKKYVIGIDDNEEIDKEITLTPFIFNDNSDQPFILVEDDEDIKEIKRILDEMVALAEKGEKNE